MEENNNDVFVQVHASRYEQLIREEQNYGVLLSMIVNSSDLSYNKESLSLSDSTIVNALKALCPGVVEARIKFLKEEAEK